MGYSSFKSSPKAVTTGDQIGPGQVTLSHLDPALYQEIRGVQLHNHSGAKSRRINLKDVEGVFGTGGFYQYSSDGTKRYKVTINSATGAFVLTEA
jgi:hypothetical protein